MAGAVQYFHGLRDLTAAGQTEAVGGAVAVLAGSLSYMGVEAGSLGPSIYFSYLADMIGLSGKMLGDINTQLVNHALDQISALHGNDDLNGQLTTLFVGLGGNSGTLFSEEWFEAKDPEIASILK